MKVALFLTLIAVAFNASPQKAIKIGNLNITPSIVDSSKFSLFGNWKVIQKTYVAESPHTNNAIPLEEVNLELFNERKIQGEIIYGSYAFFGETLYEPYCPYLPSLIINPKYKEKYIEINVRNGDFDPRLGNQKLLSINVLCPLFSKVEAQVEFSIIVLSPDLICILDNNAYTYLERVKEVKVGWTKDKDGYYVVNLMGSSDIEILLSDKILKGTNSKLEVLFSCGSKDDFKYTYVENFNNNYCNDGKSTVLFPEKNIMVTYHGAFSINNLKSKIIRINGGTKSQKVKWQVQWRILSN